MQMEKNFLNKVDVKKGELVTIYPNTSVEEAARLMRKHHVGDLIVMKEKSDRQPMGIITDRDIVVETLGQNVAHADLAVSDIMTRSLVTAKMSDSPFEIVQLMKKHGVTRIPLTNEEGSLVGIITAKNLTRLLIQTLADLSELSERQRTKEVEARH